jgi:hypothetical protein
MNELQQNLTIVMEEILGVISSSPITQGLYDELLGTEGLPKVEAPEPTFEEEDDVWETLYEPYTLVYSGETNKLTKPDKKALIKYLNEAIANDPSIPSGKISVFDFQNIVALSEMSEYPNIMIVVKHNILMDNNIAYAIDGGDDGMGEELVVEKLPIIEGTGQLTARDIIVGFKMVARELKPSSLKEESQLPPRTATKPLIRSPYTLVFDKPYHSNPPPLSPLADAYYGSKAYYDKGSDKEISIHVLNANVTKPPKCPQISGGSAIKWVVSNPYNATCILVKKYPKQSQPKVETFVAQVHRALGMPAPDMRFHQTHLLSPLVSDAFQPLTSTKMKSIVKQQYSTMSVDITNNAFRNAVDLLIVSTWLVNWDVLGISGDNSLIDDKGNIQCIDLGGALMFRATGGWKGEFEKWNADWGADYQTIKTNMIKALMQMQSIGTNKQFQGLLNHSIGKKEAELITEKMMMLFHPQYNYIEKLIVWTNMPAEVYADGYSFESKINPLDTKDLNKIFVTWLQARALALYEIVRGI